MQKEYPLNLPTTTRESAPDLGRLLLPETLLRLNPVWIVGELAESGEGSFTAQLTDHGTGESLHLSFSVQQAADRLTMTFSDWYCKTMTIQRTGSGGHQAIVTYEPTAFQEDSEEERFIVFWLRAVQEYLRLYCRRTWNTLLFRTVMNKVVLQMTPSQRKISLMLLRITYVEILVIVLIILGYIAFVHFPAGGS